MAHCSRLAHLPVMLLGIVDWLSRLPLPARSPDLHRVVERAHARICGPFQALVMAKPQSSLLLFAFRSCSPFSAPPRRCLSLKQT